MSSIDTNAIKIISEYIPKRKQINVSQKHAMNKKYVCGNPNGPVYNFDCPEENPLCNCPCQELFPTSIQIVTIAYCYENLISFSSEDQVKIQSIYVQNGDAYAVIKGVFEESDDDEVAVFELVNTYDTLNEAKEQVEENGGISGGSEEGDGASGSSGGLVYDEPKNSYLNSLQSKTKECSLIESLLGPEWLGCDWEDPESPYSCNCPCYGKMYGFYLRFNKTAATFWDTPAYVPLISDAHRAALISQQVGITVHGDLSIRPGDIVELDIVQPKFGFDDLKKIQREYSINLESEKNVKFNGQWMVSTIRHRISSLTNHVMDLVLIRDGWQSKAEDEELEE